MATRGGASGSDSALAEDRSDWANESKQAVQPFCAPAGDGGHAVDGNGGLADDDSTLAGDVDATQCERAFRLKSLIMYSGLQGDTNGERYRPESVCERMNGDADLAPMQATLARRGFFANELR